MADQTGIAETGSGKAGNAVTAALIDVWARMENGPGWP